MVREELNKKEIIMEVKPWYILRLFFTTRLQRIILVLWILGILYMILYYPGLRFFNLGFFMGLLFFIVFMFYIRSKKTTVLVDKDRIEFHFYEICQISSWKSLEGVEVNINPKMKKEQIVFREKNRSWEIKNLHYKDDSWSNLKRVIQQYAKEYNIIFESKVNVY